MNYLVAGHKSWNRRHFEEIIAHYPGTWHFISEKHELSLEYIEKIQPQYIFFLHWSYIIPESITSGYTCICFHMTDVPYGRGGSPLQNLIAEGNTETKVTALKMTKKLDAGPVYFKEHLCLAGSAEEIFMRAGQLCARMIKRFVLEDPAPVEQSGTPVCFPRRTPEQSEIQTPTNLDKVYDMIRMLDAEGYPRAFIEKDGFRYEFHRGLIYSEHIRASVTITPIKQ